MHYSFRDLGQNLCIYNKQISIQILKCTEEFRLVGGMLRDLVKCTLPVGHSALPQLNLNQGFTDYIVGLLDTKKVHIFLMESLLTARRHYKS